MSNGDEITRKAHIKRIYKDNDPNSGTWVDVERIDEIRLVSKRQFPWREKRWQFDWDNFDPDGENVTKKKIKQRKSDDDSTAVEVPVRDMVFVTEGNEQQYQGLKHYFTNDNSNSTRETHSRRVYHHTISDNQLDGDGNPPRDPQDYLNALKDQDKSQYVDVEILDKFWTNERQTRDSQGNIIPGNSGIWQEKKWLLDVAGVDPLLREPLFDSDDTSGDNFNPVFNPDAGQIDPPWRLDPLQNIVNVQFGADFQGLLADWSGFVGGSLIGGPGVPTAIALDSGDTFENVNMGASGLGKTVLTKGLVCFGKPKNGDACFIICSDFIYFANDHTFNSLQRGVIDDSPEGEGNLKWTDVGGGEGLIALTFAGDAFFAVYKPSAADPARIETSYDGIHWSSENVFPVQTDTANDCSGGAVAAIGDKDSRSYVAVGAISQFDQDNYGEHDRSVTFVGAASGKLAWSISDTGVGWSGMNYQPKMDTEPGAFTGEVFLGSNQVCTVCGGQDVFVAAASGKDVIVVADFGNFRLLEVQDTAAVAVSSDGNNWSTVRLPGVVGTTVDSFSDTRAVAFVKTSKDPTKGVGYFLATSTEVLGDGNNRAALWKSSDGFGWEQIGTADNRFYWTLSVIAKQVDPATIVRI